MFVIGSLESERLASQGTRTTHDQAAFYLPYICLSFPLHFTTLFTEVHDDIRNSRPTCFEHKQIVRSLFYSGIPIGDKSSQANM